MVVVHLGFLPPGSTPPPAVVFRNCSDESVKELENMLVKAPGEDVQLYTTTTDNLFTRILSIYQNLVTYVIIVNVQLKLGNLVVVTDATQLPTNIHTRWLVIDAKASGITQLEIEPTCAVLYYGFSVCEQSTPGYFLLAPDVNDKSSRSDFFIDLHAVLDQPGYHVEFFGGEEDGEAVTWMQKHFSNAEFALSLCD